MKKQLVYALLVGVVSILPLKAQEYVQFGNGNIIPLDRITQITQSWQEHPASLSLMLEKDESIKLFTDALKATGWLDSLKCYSDKTYSVGADSTAWNNDALVFRTATEYDNVAYPVERLISHTVFVEPDTVLEKRGIKSLDDLKAYAKNIYDQVYPESASIADVTDLRNSLNRFMAYHILPFKAGYYQLTCVDGPNSTLAINWNRRKIDISDWYETMMPYSILKCSFPSATQAGLYINRRGVQSRADERDVYVRGAKVVSPEEMNIENTGVNGIYHYIDDIIAYDENTQKVVLNERMRIDASTLSPDFMSSGARGHYTRSVYEGGKYGIYDTTRDSDNKNTCLGFKAGSAKNFSFEDSVTHIHVRPRTLSFWSYQADEVTISGAFDVTVKLPPVPAGTYELRLGTCINYSTRGIVAFYLDGMPTDTTDMRLDGKDLFGWKSDSELGDDESIANFDREIHAKGWMKGPKSYYCARSDAGGDQGNCFRDMSWTIRKVIGTFVSDGKNDHYLRMKQLLQSTTNTMDFDYIELVPADVYDNENYPEDQW